MRLISLNIWRGKLHERLLAFITREAKTTDIFCLQEVLRGVNLGEGAAGVDIYSEIQKRLPDFEGFFEAAQDEKGGLQEGLAIFMRRKAVVDEEGDVFVYRTRNSMVDDDGRTMGRNLQFLQFPHLGKKMVVLNFHGLWTGDASQDTPAQIEEAHKVREVLEKISDPKIICGDFNVSRDTESLAIIDAEMRNLVKEKHVLTTRNHYFPYAEKFADYVIASNDIDVTAFRVMPDEISDHQPLLLDFA